MRQVSRQIALRAVGDWLPILDVAILALLFIVSKRIMQLPPVARWRPLQLALFSGRIDVLALIGLGFVVSVSTRIVQCWLSVRADVDEQRRLHEERLAIENEAVLRACRAVAYEFAQPLSGALGYSELLLADQGSSMPRQELEGLREGVLRLEWLLQALWGAVHDTAGVRDDRRVADDVERAVAGPLPRARPSSFAGEPASAARD